MVTREEIDRLAIFESVPERERDRLVRVAADIWLTDGEYAAHEGDERQFFVVLEGTLEAVKMVDGDERVLGRRGPGDIIGEVALVMGTPYPAGFRSVGTARVMRLAPRDYHTLAATAPEVAQEVGRLAGHRMSGAGGLHQLVATPPPPRALVIGRRWDPACAQLRRFLDRNQVSFRWLESADDEAVSVWDGPLPSEQDWPVIRIIGGKTVIKPQMRRVAELLGLGTEAEAAEYDTVIVGAGPAGLAAAVYGASEGLCTIVVEQEAPGGQAGTSSRIENYLGFPSGVSGDELASRALRQARRLGAEILVTRTITRIDPETRHVHLDGGDVIRAKTIILACGVVWRQLPIEGFDRLAGRGISYGAARSEAPNTHGLDVHIVGAGNSAGQAALFFSTHARSVSIVCRGGNLEKSMSSYLIEQIAARPKIRVLFNTEVTAAHGEAKLEALDLRDSVSGETARVESGGLFIFIGADAQTAWLPPEVELDQRGFVLTGPDMRAAGCWPLERDPYLLESSVPGIFACGDVRSGPVKRVAAAVGEGSMAIAFVHQYFKDAALAASPRAG